MSKVAVFFANGNTAVCHGRRQVPELQQSWLLKFVEFLESKGENPLQYEYQLPSGTAHLLKTDHGYNWQFD